jgi:hypothetical protein
MIEPLATRRRTLPVMSGFGVVNNLRGPTTTCRQFNPTTHVLEPPAD